MKVLNIFTSPLVYDGISMSVLNYFNNIDNQKIQMDFVTPSVIAEIEEQIKEKGGRVYIVKGRKKHPLNYIKQLSALVKNNRYDIVQAHGSSAMLCLEMIAAKKAGCKIRIAHCRNTKCDHKILDKLLRPIFYKTYTHGFACGEKAGKWLFRNRKFEIINNGKDIDKFKYNEEIRKEYREKYNLNDKIVIGHVGNFNEQKNHDFLIDVFYNLTKIDSAYYLVLIGRGYTQPTIEKKIKTLGIEDKVLFVGRSSEVEKWIQAMDIMVFPSKFEGFPNVLVEWQIAGLPCVISSAITNEVKLTDLVQFISLNESPKYWAEKINQIKLQDRNLIKDKVVNQIKEQGYDIKENAKKLEKIYEELIKEVG